LLEVRSPDLRQSQAVSYTGAFFPGLSSRTGWLDGFAVPALVVELVETQRSAS